VTFSGLASNATAAHIHLSSDSSIIVTLEGGAGAIAGTFTIPAGTFLTAPQLKALANDGLYFQVHSVNNPNGELRGDIAYPVSTIPSVSLNGAQEVPPVVTTGTGLGNLTVNLGTGVMSGTVSFTVPSIADRAHIHQGFAGENGGIIITLQGGAPDTQGTFTVPGSTRLTALQLGDLISERMYLNIHTASNTGGEIRGQIRNVPTN
jgi:hypothetical protein